MSLQYRTANCVEKRSVQGCPAVRTDAFRPFTSAVLPRPACSSAAVGVHSSRASIKAFNRRGLVGRQQAVTVRADAAAGKKVVIITGASSGLGLNAARVLAATGEWHVVMACRDFLKAETAAKRLRMAKGTYSIIHLDLSCLNSVKKFLADFRSTKMPLNAVVCNAAVYLPTAKEPRFTAEGFEISVGTNHLGHFMLATELLKDLQKSKAEHRRMIIVGSITGNTNTLAGNVPPRADLGDLSGLASGLNGQPAVMIDGGAFDGAKAYKDSKVCNMLTMRQMHNRYHASTGIEFASLYPGCIATTGLFREHYPLFKTLFPPFQKYITKGYVSEEEAGERLAQVVSDPKLSKSGTYWSWNRETGTFSNQVSEEVSDDLKGSKLWELSEKVLAAYA